jgi:hypothetical protein
MLVELAQRGELLHHVAGARGDGVRPDDVDVGDALLLLLLAPHVRALAAEVEPAVPPAPDGAARGAADAQGPARGDRVPRAGAPPGGLGVVACLRRASGATRSATWSSRSSSRGSAPTFYEFAYHRLGHTRAFWWKQHKPHHAFSNPSPFAVIADDLLDQLIRSAPLLLIPLIMPINMDLLFLTYGAFFYGYGVYLHWGFELRYPRRPPPLDQHQLPALRAPRQAPRSRSPCTPGSSSSSGTSG